MYDRRFFASRLGLAAMASIAAMVTFNIFALTQLAAMPPSFVVGIPAALA